MGYDAFFLGFPFGLYTPMKDFEAPFIKKGVISSIVTGSNGISIIYLDGHNNPGFSGGPITFKMPNETQWHICGVILGYKWEPKKVLSAKDTNPVINNTNSFIQENSGIVLGENIVDAVDAINARPIGPLVSW